MRQTTIATKKPSTTDAKFRASTTDDANLSPIKEEDIQMPEVQGSSNTPSLTSESMEPLSDLQKDFFQSYLDENRNRMEEDRREERRSYEETISRMQEQIQEMREDYDTLRRSRSSPAVEFISPNMPLKPRKFNAHKTRHTKTYSQPVNNNLDKTRHQHIPSGIRTLPSLNKPR